MNDNPFQALDSSFIDRPLDNDKLYVTDELCVHWKKSSEATYGIAIVGFLVLALMVMFLSGAMSYSLVLPEVFIAINATSGFIVFKLSQYLYRFSHNIDQASEFSDWGAQERAFASLCSAYTIFGLCVLLTVILMVAAFSYVVYVSIL